MEIKKGTNTFFIGENEENPVAEIHYVESKSGTLNVDHTFVSKEYSGQGIGSKLVDKVAEYAREKDKKIYPSCDYARSKMENNMDYQDVLV